ncbi:MAG: sigma-54-dependent Fis family transcriptional regulator [Lentisphaerae bacterium]|nr:sigma-54-dependent Fis family transcriptional regulator [Lentisphaerota bacterium]
MQLRVLLLIRKTGLRSRLRRVLRDVDADVRLPDPDTGWDAAEHVLCDVLVAAHALIPVPAAARIRALAGAANPPALVILSDRDDAGEAAVLRAAGADAVLYTNIPDHILADAITGVVENRRKLLVHTVAARRATPRPELSDFVSESPVMQRFMRTVQRVADSDAPLLITGETGVGKERLARAIHYDSRRADGPFVSVNCGAIPENLLESQLFGHEKGSFTGATRTQRGCFELAHGGTLFLDEISEMPFHLQVKLLHVLQDYEIAPVGSEKRVPVDVRVIAATNRDIKEEIEARRFRKDLYYRLGVVSIDVPPLRERRGDIPLLARSILDGLSARIGCRSGGIAPDAMEALCEYAWPGNVRELINVLERALLLCEGPLITLEDLPDELAEAESAGPSLLKPGSIPLIPDAWLSRPLKAVRESAVEHVEKAYLGRLLAATEGRVGETARRAGIEPRSLFNKMKRYGLRKEDFRPGPAPRT